MITSENTTLIDVDNITLKRNTVSRLPTCGCTSTRIRPSSPPHLLPPRRHPQHNQNLHLPTHALRKHERPLLPPGHRNTHIPRHLRPGSLINNLIMSRENLRHTRPLPTLHKPQREPPPCAFEAVLLAPHHAPSALHLHPLPRQFVGAEAAGNRPRDAGVCDTDGRAVFPAGVQDDVRCVGCEARDVGEVRRGAVRAADGHVAPGEVAVFEDEVVRGS